MGYWRDVAGRSFKAAGKSVRVETREAAVILIVGQAVLAGLIWFLSGNLDVVTRLGTVFLPFILFAPLWLWHFARTPPAMFAEQGAQIASLTQTVGDLQKPPVVARPLDMVKAKGLLTRLSILVLATREKMGGQARRRAVADACEADLNTLLGLEAADALILKHPTFFVGPNPYNDDTQVKLFGLALQKLSDELRPDQISSEHPDLPGYLDRRLSELRGL